MKRRNFLRMVAGAAVAPALPGVDDPVFSPLRPDSCADVALAQQLAITPREALFFLGSPALHVVYLNSVTIVVGFKGDNSE